MKIFHYHPETGTFSEADAEQLTDALAAGYLDGIYTLGAPA
jgi:hypothetical protein